MPKRSVKPAAAKIKLQLSNFSFVHHGKKNPRMLRFTLAFLAEGSEHGDLGIVLDGCLLRRLASGDLAWNPPRSFTSGGLRKTASITQDFYNLVMKLINGTKYPSHIGDVEGFKKGMKVNPQEIDEELPKELEG